MEGGIPMDLDQVDMVTRQMQDASIHNDNEVLFSIDALELIFRFIDVGRHLGLCMQVCTVWQTVGLDEKLWSALCSYEEVPVHRPRQTWFRTFNDFAAGSWRFQTSNDTRVALRAALPLLVEEAAGTSLFSWTPMDQPRWWQWGSWSLCNCNEVLYIMSTLGTTPESPFPWLTVEVVANSNGWFRFTEKRVPEAAPVNILWEMGDVDDEEQPFEKPQCAVTVKTDAAFLPCGFYAGGIPQYSWDILVRPRQLFIINPDGILEFRKHAMGFLYSDQDSSLLFPRPGRTSARSLSTWLMSQPTEEAEAAGEDESDGEEMMDW